MKARLFQRKSVVSGCEPLRGRGGFLLSVSWLSACFWFVSASACTARNGCTDELVYGLAVKVVGGANELPGPGGEGGAGGSSRTGESLCAATVVARDGGYEEELECRADGDDCDCWGAGEREGKYTVEATLRGQTETARAEVKGGRCHVVPTSVVLFD